MVLSLLVILIWLLLRLIDCSYNNNANFLPHESLTQDWSCIYYCCRKKSCNWADKHNCLTFFCLASTNGTGTSWMIDYLKLLWGIISVGLGTTMLYLYFQTRVGILCLKGPSPLRYIALHPLTTHPSTADTKATASQTWLVFKSTKDSQGWDII